MSLRERILWLLSCALLIVACGALWFIPRLNGQASESKELRGVRGVAGRVLGFAESNGNLLPKSLSELTPDYLQLGEEDRSLIWGIPGNREVDSAVQKVPSLLRYAIVASETHAIVHQVPSSDAHRGLVWQHIRLEVDGWALASGPDSGSYLELAEQIAAVQKTNSEVGARQPATAVDSKSQ